MRSAPCRQPLQHSRTQTCQPRAWRWLAGTGKPLGLREAGCQARKQRLEVRGGGTVSCRFTPTRVRNTQRSHLAKSSISIHPHAGGENEYTLHLLDEGQAILFTETPQVSESHCCIGTRSRTLYDCFMKPPPTVVYRAKHRADYRKALCPSEPRPPRTCPAPGQ